MATKKKTEKQIIDEVSKLIAEETLQATDTPKKKSKKVVTEPTVVKGNHLTVTTYPDGRTELVWDDEALLKEVKDAILSVEQVKKPAIKSTRKKKVTND
jgi:hypothetical protein